MDSSIKICEGVEIKGNELKRYTLENLKPGEDEKIWDEYCIYNLEKQHLLNKFFPYKCEQFLQTGDKNHIDWEKIRAEIRANYVTEWDSEILSKLRDGFYRKHCPSSGEIKAWKIAFILSIIGETTILVIQSIFSGGFNPMILLFAFLLALGGWLVGKFFGKYFWISKLKNLQMYSKQLRLDPSEKGALILGTILIVFVALVRAVFGGEPEADTIFVFFTWSTIYIFLLTILLGATVAFTEAMKLFKIRMREECLISQQKALQMFASKKHDECLKDGTYMEMFMNVKESKGIKD